jgi:hypothetical protein
MKSRKKIVAGMVAMALGSGAYAATFEGRLACDQDPRDAASSCMLYVPVTDTVGLPVYSQQISVTSLIEPRGEAAAGMESEAQASSDISASAPLTESFSTEPPSQASISEELTYPKNEVDEGRPVIESERVGDASSTSSRGGLFAWFTGERGSRSMSEQSVAIDAHPGGLVVTEGSPGPIQEGDPFVNHQELLARSSERPRLFSWLTGERGSRSPSEQSAAGESESPDQLTSTESSEDPDRS